MRLEEQFSKFHNNIKATMTSELKEKRTMFEDEIKNKFPYICDEHEIKINKSDLSFFMQGSYSISTAIDAYDSSVDLDLAVAFPFDVDENKDCRVIKGYMRDSIDSYNRTINYKVPCITVTYLEDGEESYHIDFPIYAIHNDKYYLAKGKEYSEDYEWELSDPKGLKEYLEEYLANNPQLRRTTRYLKCWKLNTFNKDNGNEMPPSITLTLLACQYFEAKKEDDHDDDLEALYNVVKKIKDSINSYSEDPYYHVKLPVTPYTDTMFKINSNSSYRKKFKNKIYDFELQLRNAKNAGDEHTAGEYVRKVLGEEFEVPEKQVDVSENRFRRTSQFG